MKKILRAGLYLFSCISLLTGCGTSVESNSPMLYIDSKGQVTEIDVMEMEGSYDEDELRGYVEDSIASYTEEYGKNAIKLEELEVDGQIAKIKLKYKTTQDYTRFNYDRIELYQGKVKDILRGDDYNASFQKVEKGRVVGTATKDEVHQNEELQVVVIRANMDVKIEGEICYVSAQNVKLTGTDTVSVREDESGADSYRTEVYTYIIYQ